jgi:ubiquinone/menaquinone biosynthesis C-methylase UbiE
MRFAFGSVESGAEASGMTAAPERWQLEGDSAELYERYLVPPVTLPWALDLVERVGVKAGDRVLDVACGTGAVARVAAERVGEGGRVVGVDVNRSMLRVARERLPELEWREGSVLALPFADGEFDVVFCQLGLQFFPDRPAALQEMRRVLAPGGRFGASVYSSIERNPAADALSEALDRQFGEGASRAKRHEHSLPDRAELAGLLATAGFAGAHVETITREVRFASVEEWVRIQFAATPLATLLEEREPPDRERLIALVSADVGARLARSAQDGGLAFPQEVHVAVATA